MRQYKELSVAIVGVSIHAPVKGATFVFLYFSSIIFGFNSRTRKGCDTRFFKSVIFFRVSIHAPVKGATQKDGAGVATIAVSIHAPVKGATIFLQALFDKNVFQFTHP